MSGAACVRCGAMRPDYAGICPDCGHRPVDDGLLVAWLLSTEHLDEGKLEQVARRIRDGERIRPSESQLQIARKALGRAFSTDPGLSLAERLALLASSLILTPLPAWFCFVWWLNHRPRAAWQAFSLAIPGSVIYFALGVYLSFWPMIAVLLNRAGT